MGVSQLWDDDDLIKSYKSLKEFASDFYEENNRAPKVAVDGNIVLHQVKSIDDDDWKFFKTALYKLSAFIEVGIDFIMVFDGSKKPQFKRDIQYDFEAMGTPKQQFTLQTICLGLGIPYLKAAGEGEAECSWLQMEGEVDYVFSDDTDCLLFGATKILRYKKEKVEFKGEGEGGEVDDEDYEYYGDDEVEDDNSSSIPDPGANSNSRDSSTPTRRNTSAAVDRMIEIIHVGPNSQFERPQYILRALLQGGDYSHGVKNIGYEISKLISAKKTGFAQELADIFKWDKNNQSLASLRDLSEPNQLELKSWRDRLKHELKTNESKFLIRKCHKDIGDDFPKSDIAQSYYFPTIRGEKLKETEKVDINSNKPFPKILELFDEYRKLNNYSAPDRVWKTFISNIIYPVLILRIRRNEDKSSWYDKVTKFKGKKSPKLDLYNVDLKIDCYAEILGIPSMDVPINGLSRSNSMNRNGGDSAVRINVGNMNAERSVSRANGKVQPRFNMGINTYRNEYFSNISNTNYKTNKQVSPTKTLYNGFSGKPRQISSTILKQSKHNLLKISTSVFTNKPIQQKPEKKRSNSGRKRKEPPSNNRKITFTSTKSTTNDLTKKIFTESENSPKGYQQDIYKPTKLPKLEEYYVKSDGEQESDGDHHGFNNPIQL